MRRTFALGLLVLVAAATVVRAQDDSQAVLQLERDWAKAALAKDAATMDRMLAADYVYTDADNNVISKKQWIDGLKSGNSHYEAFTVDDMKVYLHGCAAVVVGRATVKGAELGHPIDEQSRFTDTWVKEGSRWVAVATQSNRIQKK